MLSIGSIEGGSAEQQGREQAFRLPTRAPVRRKSLSLTGPMPAAAC